MRTIYIPSLNKSKNGSHIRILLLLCDERPSHLKILQGGVQL